MSKEDDGEFDLILDGEGDWYDEIPCLGVGWYSYQTTPVPPNFQLAKPELPIRRRSMSQKILVPLDGSAEAEGVLPLVRDLMTPESEVILFQVIPPGKSQSFGERVLLGSEVEEAKRNEAMAYFRRVVNQLGETTGRWRGEVAVSSSVADGIVGFAVREGVDLIGMYTHDRKGLAKLIRGSIAEKVQRRAPIEVQVFRPRELVAQA